MELRCIEFGYRDNYALLLPGDTTIGGVWTDEEKRVIYADHPGRFEIIEDGTEELVVETPESGFTIETPEDNLPKTRKK